jgi:hypothetical protein
MIPAKGDDKVSRVRAREPEAEGKSAGEPAIFRENVGGIGQPPFDKDRSLRRLDRASQRQLDIGDLPALFDPARQAHFGEPQEPDLDIGSKRHRDQRDRGDHLERIELDAGGEPVFAGGRTNIVGQMFKGGLGRCLHAGARPPAPARAAPERSQE